LGNLLAEIDQALKSLLDIRDRVAAHQSCHVVESAPSESGRRAAAEVA